MQQQSLLQSKAYLPLVKGKSVLIGETVVPLLQTGKKRSSGNALPMPD